MGCAGSTPAQGGGHGHGRNYDCEDCYGCSNCTDCESCEKCRNCRDCEGLVDCHDCTDCETMTHCRGCHDCENMHNCQNCYDCENCKNCVDCHGCENLVNCRGLKNESNKQNVDASYYAGAPPPSAPPAVGYPAPPGGSGYPPPGAATGYPPPGAAVQPVRHARPLTPLERAEATFRQFDHDHNGRLDIGEFANVLVAMGMISSASAPSVQKTVQIEFEKVDKDRRGITLAEFRPYFFHLMRLADRHAPGSVPAAMDPPAGAMRPYHQTRQPGPVTRKKQGGGVGAAGLVGAAAVGVGAGALAVNPGLAGDALGAVGDVAGDAVAWGGGAFESAADFTGDAFTDGMDFVGDAVGSIGDFFAGL